MRGKIVKGIAGFYYVHVSGGAEKTLAGMQSAGIYECKAKGIFRKDNKKPLVGDDVEMEVLDEEKKLGNITAILPRHSELIRPAVANVDQALVVFSIVKPQPNFNLLDRFLIMMGQQGVPCIICFNKLDIDKDGLGKQYEEIYRRCGYQTMQISAREWAKLRVSGAGQFCVDPSENTEKDGENAGCTVEELLALLNGKTTTVAGPSGVGKSSLINCLQSNTVMETGSISEKIERGKHTTRHSELIAIGDNTYILDTPGFSSLGLFDLEKEVFSEYSFVKKLDETDFPQNNGTEHP